METNISMYGEAEEFDLKINEKECRAAHCIAEDGEYEYDIAFYPIDEEHYFEIIYTSIIPDDNEELRITDKDIVSILSSLVLD